MREYFKRTGAMRLALAAPLAVVPAMAFAQEAPSNSTDGTVGTLMMFTLGAGLAIGILLLATFLRKRSNRDAMRRLNDE